MNFPATGRGAALFPRAGVWYNGKWKGMEDAYGAFNGAFALGAQLGARA